MSEANKTELNDSKLAKVAGGDGEGGGLQVGDWCKGEIVWGREGMALNFVDYPKNEYKITGIRAGDYEVNVYWFRKVGYKPDYCVRVEQGLVAPSTAKKVNMPDWAVGLPE